MMGRQRLPNRRQSETRQIEHRGQAITVTVGFDDAWAPREVFATGPKEGSDMQHVLSDACVLISIALQHGISPTALSRSLGSVPAWRGCERASEPASPLGAILACVPARPEPEAA